MSGGGKHRNKKNRAENKPTASPKNSEPMRGQQEHDEEKIIQKAEPVKGQQEPKIDKNLMSPENAENEVIRRFEETEETRKIIARLAKENNSDMERWIHIYTEVTGSDDEHKKTVADGIRQAVEARRQGEGRQPTAAQEQGKRECFTTEEVQEAREWQEHSLKKEGVHMKRVKKNGRNRRRNGMRKMTMSGVQWRLTWRHAAHTSRPLTQETRLRRS